MNVQQLFETVWERHWSKPRYQKSRWAKEVRGLWERHLAPAFAQVPVELLTAGRILNWRDGYDDKPTTANRALEVLSKMYSFGEERELIPRGTNPCSIVRALPEKKRLRIPTEVELRRLGLVLHKRLHFGDGEEPVKAAFCLILGVTGARPIALMQIRDSDIHYLPDGKAVAIYDGKSTGATGSQEQIVFSQESLDLLSYVPKRKDGQLFGEVKYRAFWDSVCKAAQCKGVWLRDFRKAFASVALSNGHNLDGIGELLNHQSSSTTKRYGKLLDTARFRTAADISAKMVEVLGGSVATSVPVRRCDVCNAEGRWHVYPNLYEDCDDQGEDLPDRPPSLTLCKTCRKQERVDNRYGGPHVPVMPPYRM